MIGAGAFVRFGGELGDVYEGFLPARRTARRALRARTRPRRCWSARAAGGACGSATRSRSRVDRVEAPRGRVDLVPAGELMAKKPKKGQRKPASGDVATNRRARHKFELLEKIEAGIELQGTEVKSLRDGKAQINDAYAVVDDGEVWLRERPHPALRAGQPREPRARAAAQAAAAPARDRAPDRQDRRARA